METKSLFVISSPQTIEVAGAIALTAARAGHHVTLTCEDSSACERALHAVGSVLTSGTDLSADESQTTMESVHITTEISDARAADIVIESAFEDHDLKRRLLAELDSVCPPHTVFASNTATLTITSLAAATRRPDKVIGAHFIYFSPVMKVVEIARGWMTSEETVGTIDELAAELGLETVNSEDAPGLLSTRIWMVHVNEAANNVFNKLARPDDLRKLNRTISPKAYSVLESADFIGLDNCVAWLRNLYHAYGDPKYCPSPLLTQMADAGQIGVRAGRGFFNYT